MMLQKQSWDSIPTEEVTPQMHRQIISGEKLMLAKMKFKDGFHVPLHTHENEQITTVFSGTIRFWFGENKEQVMDINAGEMIVIPPNLPHEARMIGDVEEMDSWAPPRQDWLDGTDTYLREGQLGEALFDLKTGLAGDILQKFSNYRVLLTIVGDFSQLESKSLADFIRESNRSQRILFVSDTPVALRE